VMMIASGAIYTDDHPFLGGKPPLAARTRIRVGSHSRPLLDDQSQLALEFLTGQFPVRDGWQCRQK